MSRTAKSTQPSESGRSTLVVTVDDRHRLQIPAHLLARVSWWHDSGGPVECLALAGVLSSLFLIAELPEHYQAAAARVSEQEGGLGRMATASSVLARYLATSWRLTVGADGRVTMPEEARKLGLAPSRGESAVVFARPAGIEIWARDRWLEQIEQAASRLEGLVEAVLDES